MADPPVLGILVECYSGHRGEETPRTIVLGGRRVAVAAVLDQWLAPDHRYFKLRDAAGDTYIVRHDVVSGAWELTMYERAKRAADAGASHAAPRAGADE